MTVDDLLTNEYEMHSFIRNQVERFGTLISTALSPIIEKLDVEEIKKVINEMK